ncbi:MAG: PH domain-containing protein [Candidatus Gracilibacteria bacterium]|nr:PH domain-containing protein [Candidatus Gracilibacteria bacterium]
MNKFEKEFFKKYIPESQEILGVVHVHFMVIFDRIFLLLIFGFLLPSFLLYNSELFRSFAPFYAFETFFLLVFLKIIFDIFDWYNDAWIVTDSGIVSMQWGLFDAKTLSIKYENIEGIEIVQDGFLDTILRNGRIVLHKIGSENIVMEKSFLPYDTLNEIEKNIKHEDEGEEEVEEELDKFDLLIHTLSGIVEDYMGAKGYEKKHKLTEDDLIEIEEIRKSKATIDLSKKTDSD